MPTPQTDPENDPDDGLQSSSSGCFGPLSSAAAELYRPLEVGDPRYGDGPARFTSWPLLGPLLFDNESSDARDHCANERTFLSYLRLSVYMSVVSVAIALSFHLRSAPSPLERRIAKPLGLVFWLLSAACLAVGLGNYIKSVNLYGRRAAIVQSGLRTQAVMSLVALSIIGTCIVLLVVEKLQEA
ncbi:hypothetical protein F5Y16DRAFT_192458 [Xylariaceae sp. FL0255]|nr:hypothetical protein F5Y16DRAFT_192458 [Xylariaceae sp. FL0255]